MNINVIEEKKSEAKVRILTRLLSLSRQGKSIFGLKEFDVARVLVMFNSECSDSFEGYSSFTITDDI